MNGDGRWAGGPPKRCLSSSGVRRPASKAPRRAALVSSACCGQNGERVNQALTIVIGYDGSDAAQRALARVRGLGAPATTLLVVAVAPDLRSAGLGAELTGGTFDVQRLLDEAFVLLDPPEQTRVELRAAAGDPAAVLVDIAREVAADLLVIGRRGGDFVARTLLGSVAQRAVQHAPCDVLVVA